MTTDVLTICPAGERDETVNGHRIRCWRGVLWFVPGLKVGWPSLEEATEVARRMPPGAATTAA